MPIQHAIVGFSAETAVDLSSKSRHHGLTWRRFLTGTNTSDDAGGPANRAEDDTRKSLFMT